MSLPNTSLPAADQPKSLAGKLLASTPVIMTVVATLLAGLSNSEMTRAQYMRSLAAQQQSKVGDQWNFYQGKKLRGASIRGNLDLLQAAADVGPVDAESFRQIAGPGASDSKATPAIDALVHGALPAVQPRPIEGQEIRAAVEALAAGRSDADVGKLLRLVSPSRLDAAVDVAEANARSSDDAVSPLVHTLDAWQKQLEDRHDLAKPASRNFTAARLRLESARYDAEARYNQEIAQLRELQVRLSNTIAERHHVRSQWFFFGMLAAQLAVILATLGMALKRRNLMWGFAAVIGMAAVGFGVYVYLYV